MSRPTIHDEATVAAHLARDLPHWTLVDGAIQRTYRTANWKGALMVATTIGHLAEAAWHHPDLLVTYGGVTVKLSTHTPKGITDLDFALAAKIDDVVAWRPGAPFSGTPKDARHAYVTDED